MAATPGVQLADKPQLGQDIQGAVDGYQPNMRLVLMHLLIYGGRGKVVWTGGYYLYHRPALGGELIAMSSQYSGYLFL